LAPKTHLLRTFLIDRRHRFHDTFVRVFAGRSGGLVGCIQGAGEIGSETGSTCPRRANLARSFDKGGKNPLHLSAWASEARLTVGQIASIEVQ